MAARVPTTINADPERIAVNPTTDGPTAVACADDSSVLPLAGYLTAEWVKRHYSISNSTLYAWIAAGRFPPPVKIGPRAVRWSAASLRTFEAKLMENGQ